MPPEPEPVVRVITDDEGREHVSVTHCNVEIIRCLSCGSLDPCDCSWEDIYGE